MGALAFAAVGCGSEGGPSNGNGLAPLTKSYVASAPVSGASVPLGDSELPSLTIPRSGSDAGQLALLKYDSAQQVSGNPQPQTFPMVSFTKVGRYPNALGVSINVGGVIGGGTYPPQGPFPLVAWPTTRLESYQVGTSNEYAAGGVDDGVTVTVGPYVWSGIEADTDVTVDGFYKRRSLKKILGTLSNGGLVTGYIDYVYLNPGEVDYGVFQSIARGILIRGPQPGLMVANASCAAFDPALGESATLKFDVVPIGSTPLPTVNAWTVNVVQSTNVTNLPFKTFAPNGDSRGPGLVTPTSAGVHVELPWNGRGGDNELIHGNFSWAISANCTNPASGSPPGQGGTANVTLNQIEDKSIRISDPPVANDFDPTAGENTTLKFDVITNGITNPEINWDVEVRDSTNTTFYKFPTGHSTDGRTTVPVTIGPWLGNNTSGNIISGPFTWVIAANTTATASSASESATNVSLTSQASSKAELAVLDLTDKVWASGVPPAQETETTRSKSRALSKSIFPFGRKNQSPVLKIQASGLRFEDPETHTAVEGPASVNVSLKSSASNATDTVTLDKNPQGVYTGRYTLGAGLIKPDLATGTTYSLALTIRASFDFLSFMQGTDGLAQYPRPRTALGEFFFSILPTDVGASGTRTSCTADNVKTGGFETVNLSVSSATNPKLKRDVSAQLKVRHPAEFIYIQAHGTHDGKVYLAPASGPGLPEEILEPGELGDAEVLDTVLFDTCETLDLYDYNNVHLGQDGRVSPSDPVSMRVSPGKLWFEATQPTPPRTHPSLLGYNTFNGEFQEPGIWELFRSELNRLGNTTASKALAWVSANRLVGIGQSPVALPVGMLFKDGFRDVALKAAAWDGQYYYYIPYQPHPDNIDLPDPDTAKRVHRVSLTNPIPTNWAQFPPDVAEAIGLQ